MNYFSGDLVYSIIRRTYLFLIVSFYVDSCVSLNYSFVKLNKCCKYDEVLSIDLTCVVSSVQDNDTHFDKWNPPWFPSKYLLSSHNLQPISGNNYSDLFNMDYERKPCDLHSEADIKVFSNGLSIFDNGSLFIHDDNRILPGYSYCIDVIAIDELDIYQFVALVCPCTHFTCIRKCCHDNLILKNVNDTWECEVAEDKNLTWNFWKYSEGERFWQVNKFPKCIPESYYSLNSETSVGSTDFLVESDGKLKYNNVYYDPHTYCGELTQYKNGKTVPNILTCRLFADPLTVKHFINGISYIIGGFFLLAIIIIYSALPDLRKKVHDYNIIAYTSSLLAGYVVHIIATFSTSSIKSTIFCQIVGYLLQFFFLASFFWLNIMCIDISLAFSQLRPLKSSMIGHSERRKFLYYSLYVWMCTSAITISTLIAEYTSLLPNPLRPKFGESSCWFSGRKSAVLFFHTPVMLLLMGNLALFINTSYRIFVAQRQVTVLANSAVNSHYLKSNIKNKNRFSLYLKLFCFMGVTWIFEILSVYFADSLTGLWVITDFMNHIRAIFLFFLFCWKEKVFRLIKNKLYMNGKRKDSSQQQSGSSFKITVLSMIRSNSQNSIRSNTSQSIQTKP